MFINHLIEGSKNICNVLSHFGNFSIFLVKGLLLKNKNIHSQKSKLFSVAKCPSTSLGMMFLNI